MKYILVTGGVVSGLGKGITSSSLGVLLQEEYAIPVTHIKIDPYLNTDASLLSPYEHGEVFVLEDGGQVDLDLFSYQCFADVTLTKDHSITAGKIYQQVIASERKGEYMGKTVQIVPHVTDAVQAWIKRVADIPVNKDGTNPQVCIIELGGTVGDIESFMFLESFRQFRFALGKENFFHLHVSLVPTIGESAEQKTKPTQHGIQELCSRGLQPDMIACRCTHALDDALTSKISMFCMVPQTHVISIPNVSNLYKVPLLLKEQHVAQHICRALQLAHASPSRGLGRWRELAKQVDQIAMIEDAKKILRIAIVGKYTGLANESYFSLKKALLHASTASNVKLHLQWIDSEELSENEEEQEGPGWAFLFKAHALLIPGGFGVRGIEGKLHAIEFARTHDLPFLGICLGMQLMVVEYARNVLGIKNATSQEFDENNTGTCVIVARERGAVSSKKMRVGARITHLKKDTLSYRIYKQEQEINERFRHRYEVAADIIPHLVKNGLCISGVDAKNASRVQCVELPFSAHPFYWACQFHPEFCSSQFEPSPVFLAFLRAALLRMEK